MGSARIPLLSIWLSVSAINCLQGEGVMVSLNQEYQSIESIKTWAKAFYFGGCDAHAFSRNGVEVEVIIGSPTSGLPTSEISIFLKKRNGVYRCHLLHSKVTGIVSVKESDDNISLVLNSGKVLLVVPWEGLKASASE